MQLSGCPIKNLSMNRWESKRKKKSMPIKSSVNRDILIRVSIPLVKQIKIVKHKKNQALVRVLSGPVQMELLAGKIDP